MCVILNNGEQLDEIIIEYPLGHARRRKEGIPLLLKKFRVNIARQFPEAQQQRILAASLDRRYLNNIPVNEYLDLLVI